MVAELDLITLTDPRSAAAEAYRTLRTNLTFAALDKPLETLVVASAAPGDNHAEVLANLAVTMAQVGKRTVLVDADLRRPTLHETFNVSNDQGLTAMIVDQMLDEPPLVATGVEGLWLLPSGTLPPNPADLLGSQRMERAIEALVEQADIVLFNAPPVVAVTDAAILGAKVDGLLLVVQAGRSRWDHVEQAKTSLERINVRIVGAVLNDAPRGVRLGGY